MLPACHLFHCRSNSGSVRESNATTGAAIKANFITGLSKPGGLALAAPEPGSATFTLLGGLGLLARRRRREPFSPQAAARPSSRRWAASMRRVCQEPWMVRSPAPVQGCSETRPVFQPTMA